MRYSRLAVLPVVALLCVSCGGSSLTMDQAIKWVQDRTVQICSYLPAATSAAQVILATNATLEATLESIANAICTAVANWQEQTKQSTINSIVMPCPTVNGICIEGQFVDGQTQEKGQ